MVNGNGERGFMVVGVVRNHLRQSQPDNVVMVHGHADQSLCGTCHEVDVFRGGKLSGTDEVALVFPIRIVCHQNALAVPQVLQSFFNGVICNCHRNDLLIWIVRPVPASVYNPTDFDHAIFPEKAGRCLSWTVQCPRSCRVPHILPADAVQLPAVLAEATGFAGIFPAAPRRRSAAGLHSTGSPRSSGRFAPEP